jgi:hypothetical protein
MGSKLIELAQCTKKGASHVIDTSNAVLQLLNNQTCCERVAFDIVGGNKTSVG